MKRAMNSANASFPLSAGLTLVSLLLLAGCVSGSSPTANPSAPPGASSSPSAPTAGDDASNTDDASEFGADASDDGSSSAADGASPLVFIDGGGACAVTASTAQCNSLPLITVTDSADSRSVYYAQPVGAAPAGGWPAVVLYQGTGFGPSVTWNVPIGSSTPFGGYDQVALVAALLDAGFVVIQPPANGPYWDTNVPPAGAGYDTSQDAAFIPKLLTEIGDGTFGAINVDRLYATGISSGGYMTSRMAVSYGGRFRALAIESGSYATCLGPVCTIPATLPANHPPTLFLHGGTDTIVPISTAQAYYQDLMAQGVDTKFVEDPSAGHQWLSVAPQSVVQWFTAH
jgi:poly(3-hydroxybutyrate) depolymerase